ncbi:MAG: bifunctional uroporphyrinogen-III synthetase/response regulator domain protein [Frankiales bacterium]|nr:bifunctional uroporphyrinogen-III synthetase/response regulator domain protein [Frankiales bacterium]
MTAPATTPPELTDPEELEGWTVAVTGAGRAEALVVPLQRRGARVLATPTVQIEQQADEPRLLEATRACLRAPLDVLIVTSALGLRGWLDASDREGVGQQLREHLRSTTVLARGPKAAGAVATAGLTHVATGESSWHLLEQVLALPLRGRRVAVVLHGAPMPDLTSMLRAAGAEVVELPVYRVSAPADPAAVDRLLALLWTGQVQALTFTSAAAAAHLVAAADAGDVLPQLLTRLAADVTPVCVGPVAAAPLERLGVRTVKPCQARVGELVRSTVDALHRRRVPLRVAGHRLELRGTGAVVDGRFRPLSPASMAMLGLLSRQPGHVVTRAQLAGPDHDVHAVEMAVRRLRNALGDPACIENVIKRGYRLAAP